MATAKKLDSSKLTLGVKKEIAKPVVAEIENIDTAVNRIHADEKKKENISAKEETKRMTLDIPASLHKAVRKKLFDTDQKIKDYFIGLAKKDLGIQ